MRPGDGTRFVARLAGATDLGPDGVDRAGGGTADFADQRRAAVADAAHAARPDIGGRDAADRRLILKGEARPVGRVGAAGAAGPAGIGGAWQLAA
jgi:hypothetical protein